METELTIPLWHYFFESQAVEKYRERLDEMVELVTLDMPDSFRQLLNEHLRRLRSGKKKRMHRYLPTMHRNRPIQPSFKEYLLLRRNARSFSSRAAEYAAAVAQEISSEFCCRFEAQRRRLEQVFVPASCILLILLPMFGCAGFACFCTSFAPNNSGWETWVLRFLWIPAAIGYVLHQFLSWQYGKILVGLTDAAFSSHPPAGFFFWQVKCQR